MEHIFNISIYKDVFVESHMPGGYLNKTGDARMSFALTDKIPSWAGDYIKFVDYIYDENDKIIGAKIECDLGGGYYAEDDKKTVEAYPGKEIRFTHNRTGVDDEGCPEDNSDDIVFMIGWVKEENID